MNATEGLTLAKMAIVCSLLVLVIGAGMSIWYLMWDHTSEVERNMENATNSAVSEKLYQLSEQSTSADSETGEHLLDRHPLVTTAASTMSEYAEDDLLFIYVVYNDGTSSDNHLYTYSGVNITPSAANHLNEYSGTLNTHNSDRPITAAVKKLLTYSQNRCHLRRMEVPHNNNTFVGVVVEVLP